MKTTYTHSCDISKEKSKILMILRKTYLRVKTFDFSYFHRFLIKPTSYKRYLNQTKRSLIVRTEMWRHNSSFIIFLCLPPQ